MAKTVEELETELATATTTAAAAEKRAKDAEEALATEQAARLADVETLTAEQLQAKVDAEAVRATAAETRATAAEQALADKDKEIADAAQAKLDDEAAEQRMETRLAEVDTLNIFSAEDLKDETRLKVWASLDDDGWAVRLGEFTAMATANKIAPKDPAVATEPGPVPGKDGVVVASALGAGSTVVTDMDEGATSADIVLRNHRAVRKLIG